MSVPQQQLDVSIVGENIRLVTSIPVVSMLTLEEAKEYAAELHKKIHMLEQEQTIKRQIIMGNER